MLRINTLHNFASTFSSCEHLKGAMDAANVLREVATSLYLLL